MTGYFAKVIDRRSSNICINCTAAREIRQSDGTGLGYHGRQLKLTLMGSFAFFGWDQTNNDLVSPSLGEIRIIQHFQFWIFGILGREIARNKCATANLDPW